MIRSIRTDWTGRSGGLLLIAGIVLGSWLGQAWPIGAAGAQFPDSAAQRVEIVRQLDEVNKKLAAITTLLKSGDARVRIVEAEPEAAKGPGR